MSFNPQGTKIITAGADNTARIWSADTGEELQILKGEYNLKNLKINTFFTLLLIFFFLALV